MTPNPHGHDLERELGRQLHDQVDHRHDAPFDLGDVQGRAGRIRRNRRLAVTAGVAAALAVIVPTAVLAGGGLNRSQEPDPVRPPAEERVAVHTKLTLDGVPRGDAPRDRVLHHRRRRAARRGPRRAGGELAGAHPERGATAAGSRSGRLGARCAT